MTLSIRLRPLDAGTLRPTVTVEARGIAPVRLTLPGVRVRQGQARVTVRKRALASFTRPGATLRYRIVVSAASTAATAKRVRVCDVPGTGVALRWASRGGRLRSGRACWQIGELAPGARRELRVVARVSASSGIVRNVARATAANRRGRAATSVARTRRARVGGRLRGELLNDPWLRRGETEPRTGVIEGRRAHPAVTSSATKGVCRTSDAG